MATIPAKGASLTEYQDYLKAEFIERGFDDETVEQKFMLLIEEIGELAKAARKRSDVKHATDSRERDVLEESGDVLILVLDLCTKLGVNAEDALITKEQKNKTRTWE